MCVLGALAMAVLFAASLFVGKYPLSLRELAAGNELQLRVFWTLRASRTCVGAVGGFALGAAGFVYQTVFRNPLASPDIIGVSSGASAGAAAGILFFSGAAAVTASSFTGALLAVVIVLALSALDKSGSKNTIVLAGIAVHSLAQTVLMCLKLTADPERQLASIEYWIMGSLNGISGYSTGGNLLLCALCLAVLFPLHRQIILLSGEEGEARMLGVSVGKLREVEIEDLLGREPVRVNIDEILDYVHGKVVLVTGGGGSIGSELCRQIAGHQPKTLIVFDVYENNAYDIQQELKRDFPKVNVVTLIGSVRNMSRLDSVFKEYQPDIVVLESTQSALKDTVELVIQTEFADAQ